MSAEPPIVLYDGVCGLCDRSVQWILDHDTRRVFRYSPLQGETAQRLREKFPEIPSDIDTVVLVEEGRVHLRSRAIFRILRQVGGPWAILSWFRFLPAFLTDLGYRVVAALRYRIWGTLDTCRIPDEDEAALFLP